MKHALVLASPNHFTNEDEVSVDTFHETTTDITLAFEKPCLYGQWGVIGWGDVCRLGNKFVATTLEDRKSQGLHDATPSCYLGLGDSLCVCVWSAASNWLGRCLSARQQICGYNS
jgi:hypothetical protein